MGPNKVNRPALQKCLCLNQYGETVLYLSFTMVMLSNEHVNCCKWLPENAIKNHDIQTHLNLNLIYIYFQNTN